MLAAFLGEWDVRQIVSSPYVRAVQSIEPLARLRDIVIETDKRLGERVLGEPSPDWLNRLRTTFDDLDLCFATGESSREAMERAVAVVKDVLQRDVLTTVVVTHGNLMALLLKHFDDRFGFAGWHALTNPDVYRIDLDTNETSVVRVWQG